MSFDTFNKQNMLSGILFLITLALIAKLYESNSSHQPYYSFTVNDKQIGRYSSLHECAQDEVGYRRIHLNENISPYQTNCDWK